MSEMDRFSGASHAVLEEYIKCITRVPNHYSLIDDIADSRWRTER